MGHGIKKWFSCLYLFKFLETDIGNETDIPTLYCKISKITKITKQKIEPEIYIV